MAIGLLLNEKIPNTENGKIYYNTSLITPSFIDVGLYTHYRIWEGDIEPNIQWNPIIPSESPIPYEMTSPTLEGQRKISFRARYASGNDFAYSDTVRYEIILHMTPPTACSVDIIGSTGNDIYTGIKINEDGSFTPDRKVTLKFSAQDKYDMQIRISDATNMAPETEVEIWKEGYRESSTLLPSGVWQAFTTDGVLNFDTAELTLIGSSYGLDESRDIAVDFRDVAGNEAVQIAPSIQLNTKIFKCAHKLLKTPDSSYSHQVMEVNEIGQPVVIQPVLFLSGSYTRKWEDIFYPSSHSYPLDEFGKFNEVQAKDMGYASGSSIIYHNTSTADAVRLKQITVDSKTELAVDYDSENRPVTIDWTLSGGAINKNYGNMVSSYISGTKYWILLNPTGESIQLEFEHFHVNSNVYGPPYNNLAPYNGDCLVIYDASDPLAVTKDQSGREILDSTKMIELYAYTGEGNQVMELSSGFSVNADTNGGFKTPDLNGVSRICMIFYSDVAGVSSGFKLKSSPKEDISFNNFDVDEYNGEVWLHKYPLGRSADTVNMLYDYSDTEVVINHDKGTVEFSIQPSGVITADYSYYKKEEDIENSERTRLFLLGNDDLVDYAKSSVYITPSGFFITKTNTWDISNSGSGKIVDKFTVDTDRGVLEFSPGEDIKGETEFHYIPLNSRINADYIYHTYKRLSNDGYGVLEFRDKTIVADVTPTYPDYTWNDVKIVNEGDAILENGKIVFTMRGVDTSGDGTFNPSSTSMDQVLDINRPWDVQEGLPAETYQRVGIKVAKNYSAFPTVPPRSEVIDIKNSYRDRVFDFGTLNGATDSNVLPRTRFYGRIGYSLDAFGSTTSLGKKCFSSVISGNYYNVEQ